MAIPSSSTKMCIPRTTLSSPSASPWLAGVAARPSCSHPPHPATPTPTFSIPMEAKQVTIRDMTLRNGGPDSWTTRNGAIGIISPTTLDNLLITQNYNEKNGTTAKGALYATAPLTITNCLIRGNKVRSDNPCCWWRSLCRYGFGRKNHQQHYLWQPGHRRRG